MWKNCWEMGIFYYQKSNEVYSCGHYSIKGSSIMIIFLGGGVVYGVFFILIVCFYCFADSVNSFCASFSSFFVCVIYTTIIRTPDTDTRYRIRTVKSQAVLEEHYSG